MTEFKSTHSSTFRLVVIYRTYPSKTSLSCCCGQTLDLVIDRQEESRLFSTFEILTDLPSDHFGVVGSLDFPKPCSTKKTTTCRDLRRLEQTQWCNN